MKNKYIKLLMVTGVLATSLTSCLKSESNYTDFSKAGTLVELPLSAATGLGKLTIEALPIQTQLQNIPVVVNIASPQPLGSALNVTLALGVQADIDAFNKANGYTTEDGTAYVLPPAAAYALNPSKVTIPAGQRTATANLQVNTSLLDPNALYLIPVSIIDGGGQKISNYKTILFSVQPKNKYDGLYTMKGYTLRAGDPDLTGNFSGAVQTMATAGANSIVGLTQLWHGGSGVGGISPVTLTVSADNKVTASSAINATLVQDGDYNNRYDPATKTFYVAFYWNAGKAARYAVDTLVYTGPRP